MRQGSLLSTSFVVVSFLFSVCGYIVEHGEFRWQLFNVCSGGMLQSYMTHVNAKGESSKRCLTEWRVHRNRFGSIQLQHWQSAKFLCFNRRRRVTVRFDGDNPRCYFIERMNEQGYMEIESAAETGLFLGFNRKGRFQAPDEYYFRRRPFYWMKFERYVSHGSREHCHRWQHTTTPAPSTTPQRDWRAIMREMLIKQVRATEDGPFNGAFNGTFM